MTRMFLKFNNFDDVKKFHELTQKISEKVYLQRNEYVVDAKSLMGIYSLDLTKVVTFIANDIIPDEIIKGIKQFSVDD